MDDLKKVIENNPKYNKAFFSIVFYLRHYGLTSESVTMIIAEMAGLPTFEAAKKNHKAAEEFANVLSAASVTVDIGLGEKIGVESFVPLKTFHDINIVDFTKEELKKFA